MEQFINPRVKDIQISGIRQFSNMIQNYDNLISLTIGQPDFPTPSLVKEAAKRAITENYTSYTHNAGLLELRKAACNFVKITMIYIIHLKTKPSLQSVLVKQLMLHFERF